MHTDTKIKLIKGTVVRTVGFKQLNWFYCSFEVFMVVVGLNIKSLIWLWLCHLTFYEVCFDSNWFYPLIIWTRFAAFNSLIIFIMQFSWNFPSFLCVDLTDAKWWRNNCCWPSVENWTHLSRLEVLNNYFAFFTLLCCMHVDMLLAAGSQWALLCRLIICFFF